MQLLTSNSKFYAAQSVFLGGKNGWDPLQKGKKKKTRGPKCSSKCFQSIVLILMVSCYAMSIHKAVSSFATLHTETLINHADDELCLNFKSVEAHVVELNEFGDHVIR
jgi:hypothetical protein